MARVRLDHDGMREMLKSEPVAAEVRATAERIADRARSQGRTVDDISVSGRAVTRSLADYVRVYSYTTDRAAAGVTLAHPAGLGMQAKHGVLTTSASALGLDVTAG